MEQQRKSEITARLIAKAPDGSDVAIDQRTEYHRVRYTDGWSNWKPGNRTFWRGLNKLAVLDNVTLQSADGTVLTLAPPGIA